MSIYAQKWRKLGGFLWIISRKFHFFRSFELFFLSRGMAWVEKWIIGKEMWIEIPHPDLFPSFTGNLFRSSYPFQPFIHDRAFQISWNSWFPIFPVWESPIKWFIHKWNSLEELNGKNLHLEPNLSLDLTPNSKLGMWEQKFQESSNPDYSMIRTSLSKKMWLKILVTKISWNSMDIP